LKHAHKLTFVRTPDLKYLCKEITQQSFMKTNKNKWSFPDCFFTES